MPLRLLSHPINLGAFIVGQGRTFQRIGGIVGSEQDRSQFFFAEDSA
jgi:hypothetical protein